MIRITLAIGAAVAATAGVAWGQVPQKPAGNALDGADLARIIQIVDDYAAQFDAATNDMARGLVRTRRATTLCTGPRSPRTLAGRVKDWVGVIEKLDAVADGRGILYVRVSPRIALHTTNNTLSEAIGEPATLLPVDAPVYRVAVGLAVGQRIQFSGLLFPSRTDCMREISLTVAGTMREPDFLFRFTNLRPME